MKRIIKGISILAVIVLSLVFTCPLKVFALSVQTSNLNIDSTESLRLGDLSFSNIKFDNNYSISNNTFGLTSDIKNESKNKINYIATAYYYDKNNNLLTEYTTTETALVGDSTFKQMASIDILKGYNITDIYYYRLLLTKSDDSSFKENNIATNIPSQNSQYSSYDYVIDKYDINIIVNENNTFDVTETITAYFNIPKHGIFRTIPLKNNITRLDGTTSKNRTQILNLSVDDKFKTLRENGNYKIKIGSANKEITGEKTYVIKYTYNIGKDPLKDVDELYYNIIGTDWDTVIGNVTFNITMPKKFDSSKLGFSKGVIGSINNDNIFYNIKDNTITGSYNGILKPSEALTIRCELPEGYFVGTGFIFNINYNILKIYLIPIVFLLISIILWYIFGRDNQIIETVEFYPPEGFNSLEIGFLYKGKAENQDVISLLIYLANKGYIKISETEKTNLFSKTKDFKITKLKEYDGNNINEQLFLNGLFNKQKSVSSLFSKNSLPSDDIINEVTSIDLYDNFYITMNKILSNINNKENKNKIFEKTASSKKIFIVLMIIATYCLITIPPLFTYGETATLLFALLFPGIGFTVMFSMLFGGTQTINVNGKITNSSIGTKLFGLVWGGMFGGIPWAVLVLPALLQDLTYLIGYIIGLICVFGMIICIKYLPKRTPYGNELLGKLKGFKNFLETAEKDKLEAMVMQEPSYFYDILPYTYVLGVSDKWIKKFESISLQTPSWYDSGASFNAVTFGAFMSTTMVSAQNAMTSSPSSGSSGSGSSSGGGSSGGGSGGGGGDSW